MASRYVALGCTCIAALVASCAGAAPRPDRGSRDGGSREVAPRARAAANDRVDVRVLASIDLPRERRTEELSGLAWDPVRRALYAVQDERPSIVPLLPNGDFTRFELGDPIVVRAPGAWDGEGIARIEGGFVIANEDGPRLLQVDDAGRFVRALPIPAHYASCRANLALESLSLSPDGRYLFTANESAMRDDAPPGSLGAATAADGTTVRLLRIDRRDGTRLEVAYRSDPLFSGAPGGMLGVADLAALSDTDLLVLERGYVPDVGNTIRVYAASIVGDPDVIAETPLAAGTPVAAKHLVLDLASLPAQDRRGGRGPHPLYPNYEGIALGPRTRDGGRIVFLVSDDNASPDQIPRLLVVEMRGS